MCALFMQSAQIITINIQELYFYVTIIILLNAFSTVAYITLYLLLDHWIVDSSVCEQRYTFSTATSIKM